MKETNPRNLFFLTALLLTALSSLQAADLRVVSDTNASPLERLAAAEIVRYGYLRTGRLPVMGAGDHGGPAILLRRDATSLGPQEFTITTAGHRITISGGDDVGVLYGAYRFAELMGVRFYLHGDVIPDERLKELPVMNETGKPLFALRGIQPFHDFMEGPDWWNQDDYLAYLSQLAKLRMNFIGLHCYPEGDVGPEPLVWIGLTNDLAADGAVAFSYSASWANTAKGTFGYAPKNTGQYAGGAHLLFPADACGPDVAEGLMPRPVSPEQCNEMFNRVGHQMNAVFAQARALGIRTCIGTETPLTIPKQVRQRLQQLGLNPTDTHTVRALYTGMFQRIAAAYPVDYYWLWTPEGWTWSGNKPEEWESTTRDLQAALDALRDLGHPFTLATSGWVLGPAHRRAALDDFLPKSSPMSCINQQVGHAGVEPAFANIIGRPKWAIPWMENDPNMVGPQPWAARMRHDAVDARRLGCTGLFGIHWRTKALAPNVSALAAAAWDQSWVPAGFDLSPVQPSKGTDGALGGSEAHFTAPVAGASLAAVYQHVRYNLDGYTLKIPDGTYAVTLQFNEPAYAAAGKRVFGATIQGRQVLTNLDIFARVGQNQALDLSYPNMAVTNGTLNIGFTREIEFPCIAGIVITGKTKPSNQLPGEPFTRKINCGGEKVADYEADRMNGGTAPPSPRDRAMPIEDFYVDFARANFGESLAAPAGKLMAKMDGIAFPPASDWKNGPGNLVANPKPWSEVQPHYAFVDELAALRPLVKGAGNRERFDYWLDTWRGAATMAEACCARGQLDKAMASKDYNAALAHRLELARVWSRLLSLQTAIVSSPGELGTIANLEHHTRQESHFLDAHDEALRQALGRPLPPAAEPAQEYSGPAGIHVPTVRSVVKQGESVRLRIMVLPAVEPVIHLRRLGAGRWQTIRAQHLGRAVYEAKLPPARGNFEYYISAGEKLVWPGSSPRINQTVVVW